MKKRILALALAGTTAFSMFGGLNVFATTTDDVYESYKAATVVVEEGTITIDTADFSDYSFDTAMDYDDVIETPVVDGVVYLYDFYDDYVDTKNYSVAKVEAALDSEDPEAALAAILGEGTVVNETGYGERRTIRKDVVGAWESFLDEISLDTDDYDYKFEDEDIYNFEGLLEDIADLSKSADYTMAATSELVYLMQQYDYFVDGGLVDAAEFDTGALDMVLEILNGRTVDDFSSSATYTRSWVFKLEDLMADYDKADTTAKYEKVWDTAVDYLFNTTGAATADKSELKSAMTTTLLGVELYPAADYAAGAYDYFLKVLAFAGEINGLSKTKTFQSDVDYVTDMLLDAIDALEPITTPKASQVVAAEEALEAAEGLIESDYKSGWANYEKAIAYAESVLEGAGKKQTLNAPVILEKAVDGLVAKSIPMSLKKELKATLNKAEKWLDAYKKNFTSDKNAAQVLAVMNAIENGEGVYGKIGEGALLSQVEGAIDALNAALDYSATVLGWSKNADGKWTYGTDAGYLANGWNKLGGTWYYFNADGTAKQGEWMQEDGTWYWFTSNCNAARGWAKVDGNWYYFNDGCKMMTGWVKVAGSWYYLAPSGKMVTGWAEVGGKWYYFSTETNALGQMLVNTTVDGYTLGADGAWVK